MIIKTAMLVDVLIVYGGRVEKQQGHTSLVLSGVQLIVPRRQFCHSVVRSVSGFHATFCTYYVLVWKGFITFSASVVKVTCHDFGYFSFGLQ